MDVVIIEATVNVQLIANMEYVSARAQMDLVIVIVNVVKWATTVGPESALYVMFV